MDNINVWNVDAMGLNTKRGIVTTKCMKSCFNKFAENEESRKYFKNNLAPLNSPVASKTIKVTCSINSNFGKCHIVPRTPHREFEGVGPDIPARDDVCLITYIHSGSL